MSLTILFHHFRNLSDLPTRNPWEEVVLDLLIESSEKFGRESRASDISRGARLEIDPGILSYFESIDDLESDVIHHKYISEDISDDDRNPDETKERRKKREMENERSRKNEEKEAHHPLSIFLFLYDKLSRFHQEIEVDKYGRKPEKNFLILVEKRVHATSSRKYLIIITDVGIVYIWVRRVMMSDIMLLEPPWPWESYAYIREYICKKMVHLHARKILIVDEVMRDISDLDKEKREIDDRHHWTKNRHEKNPHNIERYREWDHHDPIVCIASEKFLIDEDASEFLELFVVFLFSNFHVDIRVV